MIGSLLLTQPFAKILDSRNLLYLTIYTISVAYILFQMYEALNQYVTIELDKENLNNQLQTQNLGDRVVFQFKFKDRYKPQDLKEIPISIDNQSESQSIYVNWDFCTIADLDERSRRIIRLTPGMTLDASKSQALSVVAPDQILRESLTAEDILDRKSNDGLLKIVAPLFKPKNLKAAAENNSSFSLRLIIQLINPLIAGDPQLHAITFRFIVKKSPWQKAVAWQVKRKPKGS